MIEDTLPVARLRTWQSRAFVFKRTRCGRGFVETETESDWERGVSIRGYNERNLAQHEAIAWIFA